jgi:hypothetical protein
MKAFFARLFNMFTIVATIFFFVVVFVAIIYWQDTWTVGEFIGFPILMVIWFGLIAGLNYVVLGKPTLWNDKQES